MGEWGFAELGITDFSSVAKVCGTKVLAQGQVLSTKIKEEPEHCNAFCVFSDARHFFLLWGQVVTFRRQPPITSKTWTRTDSLAPKLLVETSKNVLPGRDQKDQGAEWLYKRLPPEPRLFLDMLSQGYAGVILLFAFAIVFHSVE